MQVGVGRIGLDGGIERLDRVLELPTAHATLAVREQPVSPVADEVKSRCHSTPFPEGEGLRIFA